MRLVLHIGQPKTGTTSLQATLKRSTESLSAAGILFPSSLDWREAHHCLTPLLIAEQGLWWQQGGSTFFRSPASAVTAWRHIVDQVEAADPETVVLSSEFWCQKFEPSALGLLHEISDDIQVICYIRHPIDYFTAVCLDESRRTTWPRPIANIPVRPTIESWREALGDVVTLRPFVSSELENGDVVADFARFGLNGAISFDQDDTVTRNPSLSAEAAEIFHIYQRKVNGGKSWVLKYRDEQLIFDLADADTQVGKRASKMTAAARAHLQKDCKDALWLRDEFGIEFPNLDYDAIDTDAHTPVTTSSLFDPFDIDRDVQAEILRLIENEHPLVAATFRKTHLLHPKFWLYRYRGEMARLLRNTGLTRSGN